MQLKPELHGFNEFEKLLTQLPQNVAKRVLQNAVTGSLREVRKDVKQAAPAHLDDQSPASKLYGSLRQNIRVIRLRYTGKNERSARIDTGKAFWGFFYEKGTSRQPARPWFLPTITRVQDRIFKTLGIKIGAGIEKEAARLYKGK